ncbi:MAG: alpha-ketoacid dehydrogenase subunit beta [Actinomycetota bacterium]|nr:alpha-ketoacid dehydrogenase subunit beta [Actinomycetota bacterium]
MELQSQESTYLDAINQALREAMEEDSRVFIIGEDVGVYGGAFKVTKGLFDKFGAKRVIDSPLCESGFIGAAVGAALMGLRPVVEVQYADFISCGWDQIVNVAAKIHYRTGDPVPLVIRAPSGAGLRAGPFHSQSPEGWFAHTPGLKVVAPATPFDARGMLKSAILEENPVIFFEHKYLYRRLKERLPKEAYEVPLGKALVRREGNDVTVISYGAMLHKAIEAAEGLAEKSISVEVVDVRTLTPLDRETLVGSVKKTGKAVVVCEDNFSYGVAAELTATISEAAFEYLDGPIVRIAPPDTPIPFSPPLEDAYLPQVVDITAAIEKLARY